MGLRKTFLNEIHKKHNGKMIDFSGWELPVEYSGLTSEHIAVREKAGIFDVSHMGEVIIEGRDAVAFVDHLVTNDTGSLEDMQVMYTFMCNEKGGVVDDLLVYKYTDTRILLVINAANIEKDLRWIEGHSGSYDVKIENISDTISQIAVQGPKAQEIIQKLTEYPLDSIGFFRFAFEETFYGENVLISRTGYTGEDGFEIYMKNDIAPDIWDALIKVGGDDLVPAGLGARDTLRFEAGLPLYGNELGEDISPVEAGLGFFVKTDKGDFIGKDVLAAQKKDRPERKIVGFRLLGKGIARSGYKVVDGENEIGHITTGYKLPGRDECIGLALVPTDYSKIGTEIHIQIRKKTVKAEVISKKFLDKKYKK